MDIIDLDLIDPIENSRSSKSDKKNRRSSSSNISANSSMKEVIIDILGIDTKVEAVFAATSYARRVNAFTVVS